MRDPVQALSTIEGGLVDLNCASKASGVAYWGQSNEPGEVMPVVALFSLSSPFLAGFNLTPSSNTALFAPWRSLARAVKPSAGRMPSHASRSCVRLAKIGGV